MPGTYIVAAVNSISSNPHPDTSLSCYNIRWELSDWQHDQPITATWKHFKIFVRAGTN